ncbi:hypothetical protein [Sneathiella limimaris]|uniref:hypothetical protein n=1 Tax=Sneathiella limimaris TaxID=1964213 RepID=UPI00146E9D78|nr:hypothetical protein [Sneathiella limimaris]
MAIIIEKIVWKALLVAGWLSVYIKDMSEKSELSKTVTDFFELWQRQISAVSRSPDESVASLMSSCERILADLQKDLSEHPTSNEDPSS